MPLCILALAGTLSMPTSLQGAQNTSLRERSASEQDGGPERECVLSASLLAPWHSSFISGQRQIVPSTHQLASETWLSSSPKSGPSLASSKISL